MSQVGKTDGCTVVLFLQSCFMLSETSGFNMYVHILKTPTATGPDTIRYCQNSDTYIIEAVSYTHLTLPTKA